MLSKSGNKQAHEDVMGSLRAELVCETSRGMTAPLLMDVYHELYLAMVL
jgi:hypothetical protein